MQAIQSQSNVESGASSTTPKAPSGGANVPPQPMLHSIMGVHNRNALHMTPLNLSSTLGSRRLKFTCIDASEDHIAIGTNAGSVYIYDRFPFRLRKLVTLDPQARTQDTVTIVRIKPDGRALLSSASFPMSFDENLVTASRPQSACILGVVTSSNRVFIVNPKLDLPDSTSSRPLLHHSTNNVAALHAEEAPSSQDSKVIASFSDHTYPITAMTWDCRGRGIFTADLAGSIRVFHLVEPYKSKDTQRSSSSQSSVGGAASSKPGTNALQVAKQSKSFPLLDLETSIIQLQHELIGGGDKNQSETQSSKELKENRQADTSRGVLLASTLTRTTVINLAAAFEYGLGLGITYQSKELSLSIFSSSKFSPTSSEVIHADEGKQPNQTQNISAKPIIVTIGSRPRAAPLGACLVRTINAHDASEAGVTKSPSDDANSLTGEIPEESETSLYASRPGRRIWISDPLSGTVSATLRPILPPPVFLFQTLQPVVGSPSNSILSSPISGYINPFPIPSERKTGKLFSEESVSSLLKMIPNPPPVKYAASVAFEKLIPFGGLIASVTFPHGPLPSALSDPQLKPPPPLSQSLQKLQATQQQYHHAVQQGEHMSVSIPLGSLYLSPPELLEHNAFASMQIASTTSSTTRGPGSSQGPPITDFTSALILLDPKRALVTDWISSLGYVLDISAHGDSLYVLHISASQSSADLSVLNFVSSEKLVEAILRESLIPYANSVGEPNDNKANANSPTFCALNWAPGQHPLERILAILSSSEHCPRPLWPFLHVQLSATNQKQASNEGASLQLPIPVASGEASEEDFIVASRIFRLLRMAVSKQIAMINNAENDPTAWTASRQSDIARAVDLLEQRFARSSLGFTMPEAVEVKLNNVLDKSFPEEQEPLVVVDEPPPVNSAEESKQKIVDPNVDGLQDKQEVKNADVKIDSASRVEQPTDTLQPQNSQTKFSMNVREVSEVSALKNVVSRSPSPETQKSQQQVKGIHPPPPPLPPPSNPPQMAKVASRAGAGIPSQESHVAGGISSMRGVFAEPLIAEGVQGVAVPSIPVKKTKRKSVALIGMPPAQPPSKLPGKIALVGQKPIQEENVRAPLAPFPAPLPPSVPPPRPSQPPPPSPLLVASLPPDSAIAKLLSNREDLGFSLSSEGTEPLTPLLPSVDEYEGSGRRSNEEQQQLPTEWTKPERPALSEKNSPVLDSMPVKTIKTLHLPSTNNSVFTAWLGISVVCRHTEESNLISLARWMPLGDQVEYASRKLLRLARQLNFQFIPSVSGGVTKTKYVVPGCWGPVFDTCFEVSSIALTTGADRDRASSLLIRDKEFSKFVETVASSWSQIEKAVTSAFAVTDHTSKKSFRDLLTEAYSDLVSFIASPAGKFFSKGVRTQHSSSEVDLAKELGVKLALESERDSSELPPYGAWAMMVESSISLASFVLEGLLRISHLSALLVATRTTLASNDCNGNTASHPQKWFTLPVDSHLLQSNTFGKSKQKGGESEMHEKEKKLSKLECIEGLRSYMSLELIIRKNANFRDPGGLLIRTLISASIPEVFACKDSSVTINEWLDSSEGSAHAEFIIDIARLKECISEMSYTLGQKDGAHDSLDYLLKTISCISNGYETFSLLQLKGSEFNTVRKYLFEQTINLFMKSIPALNHVQDLRKLEAFQLLKNTDDIVHALFARLAGSTLEAKGSQNPLSEVSCLHLGSELKKAIESTSASFNSEDVSVNLTCSLILLLYIMNLDLIAEFPAYQHWRVKAVALTTLAMLEKGEEIIEERPIASESSESEENSLSFILPGSFDESFSRIQRYSTNYAKVVSQFVSKQLMLAAHDSSSEGFELLSLLAFKMAETGKLEHLVCLQKVCQFHTTWTKEMSSFQQVRLTRAQKSCNSNSIILTVSARPETSDSRDEIGRYLLSSLEVTSYVMAALRNRCVVMDFFTMYSKLVSESIAVHDKGNQLVEAEYEHLANCEDDEKVYDVLKAIARVLELYSDNSDKFPSITKSSNVADIQRDSNQLSTREMVGVLVNCSLLQPNGGILNLLSFLSSLPKSQRLFLAVPNPLMSSIAGVHRTGLLVRQVKLARESILSRLRLSYQQQAQSIAGTINWRLQRRSYLSLPTSPNTQQTFSPRWFSQGNLLQNAIYGQQIPSNTIKVVSASQNKPLPQNLSKRLSREIKAYEHSLLSALEKAKEQLSKEKTAHEAASYGRHVASSVIRRAAFDPTELVAGSQTEVVQKCYPKASSRSIYSHTELYDTMERSSSQQRQKPTKDGIVVDLANKVCQGCCLPIVYSGIQTHGGSSNILVLACGHTFHDTCIPTFASRCPLCDDSEDDLIFF